MPEKTQDIIVDWELSRQFFLHAWAPSQEDFGVTLAIIISLLEARGIVVKPYDLELQHEAATLDAGEFLDRAATEPGAPPEGVDLTDVDYWAKLKEQK